MGRLHFFLVAVLNVINASVSTFHLCVSDMLLTASFFFYPLLLTFDDLLASCYHSSSASLIVEQKVAAFIIINKITISASAFVVRTNSLVRIFL
jgi:hypothetical protein